MPPTPERGSWPADATAVPQPYADDDGYGEWDDDGDAGDTGYTGYEGFDDFDDRVDDHTGYAPGGDLDRRHHVDHHANGNGSANGNGYRAVAGGHAHHAPWDADRDRMGYAIADGSDADDYDAYGEPVPPDPPPRDYEDYFDEDDDDILEGVEDTSNATRNALEWAVVLVGAILVALLLRASLFQAFWIPSESMETTLLTNDRVLVNKISYRLHDIHRGDIVVFERPDQEPGEIRDLIKRVIALPGETVEATDGSIYINGQRLIEPYLDEGVETADFEPTIVPEGEIFVMGDNRGDSYDSRWFGTVSEDRVIGRAFVLFWPISRLGSL